MNDKTSDKISISLSLIYKITIGLLLLVIVIMLAIWHPWANSSSEKDVITVSGQATIKAEPDEYTFNPVYEFKDSDQAKAIAAQTEKNNQVVARLKEIGVQESDIKNNSAGYSTKAVSPESAGGESIYSLNLTIIVANKDLAQKVQDYLLTTNPTGQVSAQPSFSEDKRRQLEDQARDQATKDARSKAEQIAKNTGAELGKVKSVQDGGGFGQPMPMMYEGRDASSSAPAQSFTIQPGENELDYTVSVQYYIN